MSKKYLSELIKEDPNENTIIISPTGSGKTYYIFNKLLNNKSKRYLYLCDNSNLKQQIILDYEQNSNKSDVTIMTYKQFGQIVKYDLENDYINSYDIIICDEIHNLIDYQGFNNDGDLLIALLKLVVAYDKTKIIFFTATPYYLDELANKYKSFGNNFIRLDFIDNNEIKRYTNLSTIEYTNYKEIPYLLDNNREVIEYYNYKILIYTTSIENMLEIKRLLTNDYLKPICVWSINNTKYPMDEEQLKVRDCMISKGKLLEPYNVLIINRSTETGVNIIDDKMMYCIINTTNITQQLQARGRIRHDIIELRLKSNSSNYKKMKIKLSDEWLNKPLTKKDKDKLAKYLNIYDTKGQLVKWTTIKLILENNNYIIKEKKLTINEKRTKVSIIVQKI